MCVLNSAKQLKFVKLKVLKYENRPQESLKK